MRAFAAVAPVGLVITGLLALTACSPEAPGGGEAIPPADAPAGAVPPPALAPGQPLPTTEIDPAAPFRQDFVLSGTEPFWRLDVKGTTLVLTRPDPDPVVTASGAGLTAASGKAIWTGQSNGMPLIATVAAGTCSDGMSDRVYPYTAEVKLGDLLLKGCGATVEEFTKAKPQ